MAWLGGSLGDWLAPWLVVCLFGLIDLVWLGLIGLDLIWLGWVVSRPFAEFRRALAVRGDRDNLHLPSLQNRLREGNRDNLRLQSPQNRMCDACA